MYILYNLFILVSFGCGYMKTLKPSFAITKLVYAYESKADVI